MCKEFIYREYASWMSGVYVKQQGGGSGSAATTAPRLKVTTIREYIEKVYLDAKAKFVTSQGTKADAEHIMFFENINAPNSWYKQMLRNLSRAEYKSAKEGGEVVQSKAVPLFRANIEAGVGALWKLPTKEAASRALIMSFAHKAGGRSGEAALLSEDYFTYQSSLGILEIDSGQDKTGEFKLVVGMAGATRHACIFTAFAVAYASGAFARLMFSDEGSNWLFPSLMARASPGEAVNEIFTALARGGSPA